MQITIEIENWHQAHHLGCVLADAEWAYNQQAEKWGKDDEVRQALKAYAKLFRRVARAVTAKGSKGWA